ncbi:putative membrane protein YphA (DoxX/SURF4 family) [Nocardia kruczakiae]|uniref:Membrane protein YphA (DoxX/SURF4 family) n=1 Tax=Nocardia kruczakiae TaxID=261477 RepID=A0ABU1XRT7_9NOCA|nr:DoxX family protein [Nocardia kruczakiae]MDR7172677.1 putative membrane protein YphA (DoxX/SURF4 family) [Nocardia kruczakiae]
MLIRRLARPLLASVFVVDGVDTLMHPEPRAQAATTLVSHGEQRLPDSVSAKLPSDPAKIVRINAIVRVGAGTLLALNRAPRISSLALAVTVIPATVTEQDFWNESDAQQRAAKRTAFLKDVGLLGGLLIAAADTEGKPSLGWRGRRAARKAAAALPFTATTADTVRDRLQQQAVRGRELASVAADKGADLASVAQSRGAELASVAQSRGGELAEAAREHGTEWAELARSRGAELAGTALDHRGEWAEVAKRRGADLAEAAREHGGEWAGLAKRKSAELADTAGDHRGEWAELAKHRGTEWAEAAREHGGEWAEVAKQRGSIFARQARKRAEKAAEAARERAEKAADTARERLAEARNGK